MVCKQSCISRAKFQIFSCISCILDWPQRYAYIHVISQSFNSKPRIGRGPGNWTSAEWGSNSLWSDVDCLTIQARVFHRGHRNPNQSMYVRSFSHSGADTATDSNLLSLLRYLRFLVLLGRHLSHSSGMLF